ncbi:hypothetical protein BT96DRAFT_983861 [Gymnopus androsaceus JB14]|uniref:Uncharacterized protein n=1 Tax=Gymnopus androsaceus JB14 TaxID=1447944 RepID=A0A6A4INH8_9AGAR|nr:hypothetical protein BT96DRAFT_983861 [Gymnopus androsaceus JB14]
MSSKWVSFYVQDAENRCRFMQSDSSKASPNLRRLWYKPAELDGECIQVCLRLGLLLLQRLINYQSNLNGTAGFIIDGIITLPIAFYGFWLFPDVPVKSSISAKRGSALAVIVETSQKSFDSMEIYGDVCDKRETESFGSNNLIGQWLEAIGGYSVEQTDYYPPGVTAFGISMLNTSLRDLD